MVNTIPTPNLRFTATEDVEFRGFLAQDIDNDRLEFTIPETDLSNGEITSFNRTTGEFTYITSQNQTDSTTFEFTVKDEHQSAPVTHRATINVTPVADNPTLTLTDNVNSLQSASNPVAVPLSTTDTAFTNDNTPTFSGTAEPDASLTLSFNQSGTPVQSFETQVGADGNWRIATTEIPDGIYDVVLVTSLNNGTPDNSLEAGELVIDTVAPVRPSGLQITEDQTAPNLGITTAALNFQFTSSPDELSGLAQYVIGVNGQQFNERQSLISLTSQVTEVRLTDVFEEAFPAEYDASGRTTFFRVRTVDQAGNISAPSFHWVELDNQAPTIVTPDSTTHAGGTSTNIRLDSDQIEGSVLPVPVITQLRPNFKVSFARPTVYGSQQQCHGSTI